MKKIAVFGKPGGGKSTLSKKLASATGIPWHPLDSIAYKKNGDRLDQASYERRHAQLLASDYWIIDGLGPIESFYQRLNAADTLVYVDLPYIASYWLVTKRLLKSSLVKPEGWPDGSSVLKGTLQSYRTLKLCPSFWNDDFMKKLETIASGKSLHVIRSTSEFTGFVGNSISQRNSARL